MLPTKETNEGGDGSSCGVVSDLDMGIFWQILKSQENKDSKK